MADGTLIFDTKLDLTEYNKALKELKRNATSGSGDIVLNVTVDSDDAKKAARQVQQAVEGAGADIKVGAEADSADARQAAQQVEREAEKADPKVKVKTDVDTADVKDDVSDLADEVQDGLRRAGDPFNSSGDIEIDARVNTSGISDEMRSTARRASGVGDIIKGTLGAGIIKEAGETLLDFAKDTAMVASDLEEVQNVVDVTFGSAADEINKFATTGAKAFGLTELQTKKYAGTLGSLFKSMGLGQDEVTDMSIAMSGLVGDMASFYNLDYETAFEKLRSGISGETEPLKQLGVNMSVANLEAFALSQGIKETYEKMDEAEKATLRYNYIMQATADAQGDFARTSDGFANQLRTFQNNIDSLKANVGEKLLPVLSTALNAINGMFDGSLSIGGKTQLQQEIDAAAESLSGVETNITKLQNDYGNTVLKIRVDYERSQDLLDDYEALTSKETLTEEDLSAMAGIVEQLRTLYPELEGYINNGMFTVEAGEVRALTEEYKNLAEQKAYMQLLEGIYGEYTRANLEYHTLGEKSQQAEQEIANLEKQKATLESLYETLQNTPELRFNWFRDLQSGNMDPARIQEAADALQSYLDVFGTFDQSTLDDLTARGVNITDFIGKLGDTSQLDESGIVALFETLGSLSSQDNVGAELDSINAQLTTAQEAATAAQQALTDGMGTLQTARSELEASLSAYSKMTGDTTSEIYNAIKSSLEENGTTITTSVGEMAVTAAAEMAKPELFSAATKTALGGVTSAITGYTAPEIAVKIVPDLSGLSGIASKVSSLIGGIVKFDTDGSHATGLDYVPYDNYVANLHRGESVLRAEDAAAWRAAQQSGGNSRALDTVAGALEDIASQPINVFIDSEKVAEAVREPISYAQNGASRSRALGVGK